MCNGGIESQNLELDDRVISSLSGHGRYFRLTINARHLFRTG